MVVALIALFIALGGPATAKRWIDGGSIKRNSITTTQIRNGTIRSADISKAAVEALQHTPSASVGPAQLRPKAVDSTKLADAAVGAAQLAPGAVTASRLADGAVGGAAIANGSLQAPDLGDFFGSVTVDFAPFDNETNRCQTAMVAAPTSTSNPEAKIADDLIMVTPAQAGFSDLLTLAGYPGVNNSLRIVACRVGQLPSDASSATPPSPTPPSVDPPPMRFLYLGIDAP
jgi:hypothetical protein